MPFNSLDYICFLSLSVVAYWVLRRLALVRYLGLFFASCFFYVAFHPKHPAYLALILISVAVDYCAGIGIGASKDPRIRKLWLWSSLVTNLGLLGTFKYFNFFGEVVSEAGSLFGLQIPAPVLHVLLPVGISFYTFQTMSYTIDVYRGSLQPTRNLVKFAFYVTFFPQLVMGPIVRASEFLPQLEHRPRLDTERLGRGLLWIATGLIKKVAIADYLAVNLVDRVFDSPEAYTAPEVVIALYGFTMQIYCDFSGYTDVARGSAALMGYELPINFNRPYQATSPADFWRRWHITLSRWLRDYLYFPLGGSRCGPVRNYWNLWITIFLIALWHGAAWTFVVYGVLQATAVVLHRFAYRHSGRQRGAVDPFGMRVVKVLACLQFVVFSRILFRATSIDNAGEVFARLFSGTISTAQISSGVWWVLALSFAAHYLPKKLWKDLQELFALWPAPIQGAALAGVGGALALVATSEVIPYIYEQF